MKPLAIYDRVTQKRLAYLENAYAISYTQQTNATWSGSFKLPYSDEKKQYCEALNFVEIWDIDGGNNDKYVGLFRIIDIIDESGNNTDYITYTLEHAMGTLIESNILGYKAYTTDTIAELITKILALQETTYWVLDECDYTDILPYELEDMNLLSALNAITEKLLDRYYWSFNTQIFPWEINLKKVSSTPVTDVRYQKNIFNIKKTTDTRSLCTKLWVYGKEINGAKINISSVNGGFEYLLSTTGIAKYGTISMIINDDRFEDPQHLYNFGVALLSRLDEPLITYETAIETIYEGANLKIGDNVRIITEDGLDDILVVQQITKEDLSGAPNSGKIIIGEGTIDIGLITKRFI
jgi:phage minor structural protein